MPQIEVVSFSIEDKAMLEYDGRQAMVVVKGIDESFTKLTEFEECLYGNGEFTLENGINSYAIIGGGLMEELNCGILPAMPMELYAPNRTGKVNMTIPARNFKKCDIFSSGIIFILNQPKYDSNYIVTSDAFARKLFRREANEATSMELKVKAGEDIAETKEAIERILGDEFTVQDRYEQQSDVYKVMQIEKLISYIFLTFILLIACINIIGSLAMLIIEKRDNMETLRNLGAERKTIANIFVIEVCIISTIGAIIGIVVGVLLCIIQQEYGLISMGNTDGFVVDSYPVEVVASDVLTVFITVMIAGFVAVWLPVKILTKRFV
jgi:lipoprotein-releasing system permease protein